MDLDTLIAHYFGDTPDDATMAAGLERLAIDFGVETEPGRKFALWLVMEALGQAPSPADAFPDHPDLRDAAWDYQRMSDRVARDSEAGA